MMKHFLLFLLLGWSTSLAWGQNRVVAGKVTDANSGEPLIGASVVLKGTTTGASTDLNGDYRLSVPAEGGTLAFTYTGFRRQEITLGADNTLDVALAIDAAALDEVLVVGYGTQIKSTVTGNIAKVRSEDIANTPVTSIEQSLQGRAAGVFVESNNGKPGSGIRMRIRGSSSVTASNQPLFVVDGVPINTESLNDPLDAALNPLADLNMNDVESVEILKDASAAAIYGSRGANGVVLITTKKGRAGASHINFNFQTGSSQPTRKRDFLSADEYLSYYRQAAVGAGRYGFRTGDYDTEQEGIDDNVDFVNRRIKRYSAGQLVAGDNGLGTITLPDGYATTDWQDLAFQNAQSQQADLSFSGGTDRLRYYASAGWSDQEGILVGNQFERFSGRLNLDSRVSDRFDLGLTMSLSRAENNNVSDDNEFSTPMQLVALAPFTPSRDSSGQYYDRPVTTYYNGLIELENSPKSVTTFRNLSNAYGVYHILDGLDLRGEFGIDFTSLNQQKYYGSRSEVGLPVNGYNYTRFAQVVNYNTKLLLSYNRSYAELHNFDVVAGTEFQKFRQDANEAEGKGFPSDDLKTLGSAAEITGASGLRDEYSFLSYIARLNYNYDRRYLLSLTGRVDGSSRFGKNNQFGLFPSVAAGWVLSEEGFMENGPFSFLKLRASYGITGNAGIGNFDHLGLYDAGGYGGVSSLQPSRISNPDLSWEKTAQTDIGLDFAFFRNRLSGEIDYYIKNTTDLLLDVPVPATTGFKLQTQNIGELKNHGIELVLNSNNLVGAFKWNTSFNFAANRNEVLSLAPDQELIDDGGSRYMNVVKVGEDIGAFYGAEYAGADPQTGDALWFVNGSEGDRATTADFNEANFVILGSPNPDWIAGLSNSFSYQGISLDVTFNGVWGNEIHDAAGGFMSCNGCWFDNQTRDQLDAWQNPGDVTQIPEARLGYSNGDQSRSSRYVYDGSYIRLRNITLGYDLPRNLTQRWRMSRLRIYVTGLNLATFTDYQGWDPEVSTDYLYTDDQVFSGVDFYAAPQPRTIVFGINLGF